MADIPPPITLPPNPNEPPEFKPTGPFANIPLPPPIPNATMAILAPMDSFIFLRKTYVLIFANPAIGLWLGVNIPCGIPIVLPGATPVTLMAKGIGMAMLPFIGSNIALCAATSLSDTFIDIIQLLPSSEKRSFRDQMEKLLDDLKEEKPSTKKVDEAITVTPDEPLTPETEEEFVITTEDGLEELDFGIDIIE